MGRADRAPLLRALLREVPEACPAEHKQFLQGLRVASKQGRLKLSSRGGISATEGRGLGRAGGAQSILVQALLPQNVCRTGSYWDLLFAQAFCSRRCVLLMLTVPMIPGLPVKADTPSRSPICSPYIFLKPWDSTSRPSRLTGTRSHPPVEPLQGFKRRKTRPSLPGLKPQIRIADENVIASEILYINQSDNRTC